MSSRRNSHVLRDLAELPWWASAITAAVGYAGLRWFIPAIAGSNPILRPVAEHFAGLSHWFALLFLVPLPFALANTRRRRRLLDGQTGIDSIRALSWSQFETLVSECYRRQGYEVRERGGAGPDGGVDFELRAAGKKLVVQCKHRKARTVGVEPVRALYGAMADEEAHAAVFVTSGRYTPDAIAFARDTRIKLVDGSDLVGMLGPVRGASRSGSPLPKLVEPVASATQTSSLSALRQCDGTANSVARWQHWRRFWGCSTYPVCRGTRTIDGTPAPDRSNA